MTSKALTGIHALVIGASIAGPTVAHQLTRHGARVTVVEQTSGPRMGGQLVDIRGVGRDVLRHMGIDAHVRAATEENDALQFVDRRGRMSGRLVAADFGGDGPVAEIEILRGALARIIVEDSGADYRFGDRVVGVRQDPDGVLVDFNSGAQDRFDLVIGADGVHSDLRSRLFADAPSPVHLDTYVSFWTAANHLDLRDTTVIYSEPGRTVGMRTIAANTAVMAFLTFRGGPPAVDHRDSAAHQRIAQLRGAGMGWEAAPLLAQIDAADDFYFDACVQIRLPHWSRGRVALVGDAAYCASPLSGHGATIGMVGAYVLADELARTPADLPAALRRYQHRLTPWISRVQGSAATQGRLMTPDTATGIRARAALCRLAARTPKKQWLFTSQIAMSNAFTL